MPRHGNRHCWPRSTSGANRPGARSPDRGITLPGVTEPTPPTDADISALVDDVRGADAAQERTRRRWLQQQALEEARMAGVLLDAAEQRHTVTVRTVSGRQHIGAVVLVAADCCALLTATGTRVFLPLEAITVVGLDRSIRPVPPAAQRTPPVTATLHELLADEMASRPTIAVVSRGSGDAVVGRLIAVGLDVLTVEVDDRRMLAYVSLPSLTEASFLASG